MTKPVFTGILPAFQGEFDGKEIRAVKRDGEPWFVAADVCAALGIRNHRDAVSKLDEDEKGVGLTDTLGGTQDVTMVNESGLYALIFRSRLATTPGTPQHRFRKWVTSEVLPSIRKTGGYAANKHNLLSDLNSRLAEADAAEQQAKVIRINAKSEEHQRITSLISKVSGDDFKGRFGAFTVAKNANGIHAISRADVMSIAKAARDASGNDFWVMPAHSKDATYDYAWANTYRGAQE